MYCPRCGGEFREGIERCSDCGVELLPGELPRSSDFRLAEPPADPVKVFTAHDATLLAVARSLLESEAIPYFVRGEAVQDLVGIGRLGSGFNPIVGPGEIEVPASAAARARGLLADLDAPEEEDDEDEDEARDKGGEEIGDDPYALLSSSALGGEAQALPGVPTPRDRRRFRSLVLGYLAATLASWIYYPRWAREIPDALYSELDSYFGASDLSRTINAFGWLEVPAAVVIAVGLLTFSRPARHLFVVLWVWVGAFNLLGGPGVSGGLVSALRLLADLAGGAVLALAFYGPVASAFAAAPSARRPIAERSPPPPEPVPTSPE